MSDSTNARMLCNVAVESKIGTCHKCSSDGCNNQPKFRKPTLSCMKCTGTDSEECAFGQNLSNAVACEKPVVFGDKETCFTHSFNGKFL